MKYYIIAGEASGDLHAANLMKYLKELDSNAEFRFWGGDLMTAQGDELVKHYKETAFMGFMDVVKNLGKISQNLKLCKKDILEFNPDVVIPVDYPGFNLRISEFAHNKGYKVFYYISPKIWAWKQSRVHKIKKYVDKLFIIFPFEIDFYKKFDYEVEFVGNPLLDALNEKLEHKINEDIFRKNNNLSKKPIIAVLAGSRMQEIKYNLPVMLKLIKHFPDYQFVLAAAPSLNISIYEKYIENTDIKVVYNKTYDVLMNSQAAIVTSGTATLEAALFNVPELVCYRGDKISYQIAKRLIKVKYISLVNLIANRLVIKEFIQNDMTEENLTIELINLLNDKSYKNKMLENFAELKKVSGGTGASLRAAEIIIKSLKKKAT